MDIGVGEANLQVSAASVPERETLPRPLLAIKIKATVFGEVHGKALADGDSEFRDYNPSTPTVGESSKRISGISTVEILDDRAVAIHQRRDLICILRRRDHAR